MGAQPSSTSTPRRSSPPNVYKQGLIGAQFSFSAAVGLFNSVINLALILLVNQIAKRVTGNSLW